jgi:hypothetical protein
MREELENYLAMLEGDLEVEVDLHGGRTEKSRTLRNLITYTRQELSGLTTGSDEFAGERISASLEDISNGITRNQWALIEGRLP